MKRIGAIKFLNILIMNAKKIDGQSESTQTFKAVINKPVMHTYDKQTVIVHW